MKTITLRGFIETLGVASVVASLIFVGLQLRLEQKIAIANQYQARAESALANRRSELESELYISSLTKIDNGNGDGLTPEESTAFTQTVLIDMITLDNDFYQYSQGFVSEEYWAARVERLKAKLLNERERRVYEASATRGSTSFAQFLRTLLAEMDVE